VCCWLGWAGLAGKGTRPARCALRSKARELLLLLLLLLDHVRW
jgi:hypothetical protein